MTKKLMFSPITRIEGLLSAEVTIDHGCVVEADVSGTMFRGFEWIMRGRHVTDAVYMTQRVCGICSMAHGAVASYLLDDLYDNTLSDNAQLLRNIMLGADFLQNHIRHFYIFGLPDYVEMPDRWPFRGQNLKDARLNPEDNARLATHYVEAVRAAQKSHQISALFGGKAPHQHSFVHGGVAVGPTADNVNEALALVRDINAFINCCMIPDTELIANTYNDYFEIGKTAENFMSFGLFRFGPKNERVLWHSGIAADGQITLPHLGLIQEDISRAWFEPDPHQGIAYGEVNPAPAKQGAYTWIKAAKYAGRFYEVGPLARMIINKRYPLRSSTMDRICARTMETLLITELIEDWLKQLTPGPPPIAQNKEPVKNQVVAANDSMRGTLMHSAVVYNNQVFRYNVITPSVWNFSPKDAAGERGPVESALVGTKVSSPDTAYTVLGRIIRSFDPCINCATHVIERSGEAGGRFFRI